MPQTKVQRMEIGGQLYDIIVPKNWNQSDYTAVDYIENRTHYIIPQKNNDGSLAQLLITAGAGQFGNLLTKFSPKLTIGDWVLIETETDNAVENPKTHIIQPATARYEISKLIRVGSSENNALTFDYEGTCTASIEVQAGANAADDVKFSGFIIRNENGERASSKKFKYAIKISKVEVSPLAAAYIPLDEESLTINNAGKISTVRQDELRYSGTIDKVTKTDSEWVYNVAIDISDKSELAKVFLSEYKKEYPATLADVSNFNKDLTLRFHTKGGTGYFIKATSQFTSDDKVEIDNRDNRVLPKDAIEIVDGKDKQYLLHIDTANISGNSETHIQKNILDGLCFIVGPGCNTGHITGDNDNCFELQAGDLVVILNGEPIRLRSTTNLALAPGSAQGALRGGAVDTSSITALSLNSFAYGYANFAGGKGFRITAQATGDVPGTGTYTLTSIDGIEVGQNYIVRLSSVSRTLTGKILEVDFESNTVLVDNYNSNLVIEFDDYNFEENNDFSTNPSACNYLCILEHPELGDISVGFNAVTFGEYNIASERGAVSFGRENKSLGQYAFTEGYLNEANYSSHAEGHQNKASGVTAHAEGREGTASGYASHSEGARNTASGEAAHAEGYQTVASGAAAHAEGATSQAIGNTAHAEGHTTIATGEASHTEGAQTQALGTYTHAEGWNTLALNDGAHSEGAYTKALGLTSHTEGHTTKAAGEASHAEGVRTRTLGRGSHAEGYYTKAFSDRSHAGGYKTAAGMTGLRYVLMQKNVPSSGKTTFYIDGDVTAKLSREDTCSIITNNEYVNYGKAEAITLADIPEDQASLFTQSNATLIVFDGADFAADNTVDLTKDPYKKTIFVIDKPELGLALSEDILKELNKEDPGEGVDNNKTIDVGTNAFAVGVQSRALGYGSAAFGKDTVAYGSYAFVEGRLTEAMYAAHAEGRETKALGDVSHAEGYQTKAIAAYAHAEGAQTTAEDQAAHAEGYNTHATNLYTHAEGQITNASGVASHTEGYNTAAGGEFTTNTLTGGTLSTSGAYAHAEGNATVAIGQAAHAEGRETFAKGKYAHAEGYRTSAIGDRSHAEGANDKTFSSRKAEVKDLGGTSLFTYNTTGFAEGESSHKEGYNTTAFGNYSHAEGSGSLAHGEKSHAEGSNTNATGSSAHAEGAGTYAHGPQSHAEGYKTNALGSYSHVECEQTWATGQASHAEGQLSKATNTAAHAEGYNTTASGIGAHAEGSGTTASGDASHASGVGTKATANYQTVIGKYNKEDSDALFIVGCGTGDATNQRANALTVDGSNKKTTLFGSLEVNGTSTLQDSLIVADNKTTTLGGDVTVKGNLVVETNKTTTLKGPLQVNGEYKTQLDGELAVDGPTVLNNTLTVTGATTLNDNLSVAAGKSTALGGPLTVASGQSTSLGGALTVAGATTLTDSLAVTKATTIADTLEVSKATTLKGNLTVESGKTTTLGGATTIKGAFTVANNKEASLTGSLKVTGKTELSNMLTVAEGTILSKTLEVTGKTTLKGGLDVSKGSIKLTDEANNITISGNNGTLTVDNALTATQISSTGILSTTGGLTASGGAISLNAGANGVTISGNITTINRYTTVTDTDLTTKIVNAEKLCIGSNYKNSDSDALLVVGNGTETEPNTAFVVKPDGTGYLNNRKILVEGTNEGSLESNSITTKQLIIGDTELPESILVKLIQIAKSVEFEGASGGAEVYI